MRERTEALANVALILAAVIIAVAAARLVFFPAAPSSPWKKWVSSG